MDGESHQICSSRTKLPDRPVARRRSARNCISTATFGRCTSTSTCHLETTQPGQEIFCLIVSFRKYRRSCSHGESSDCTEYNEPNLFYFYSFDPEGVNVISSSFIQYEHLMHGSR